MHYDQFGRQVAARFQLYLAAVLGAYSARVAAGTGIRAVGDFRNDAYAQLLTLDSDVRTLSRDYLAGLPAGVLDARLTAFEAYFDSLAQQPIVTLANRIAHGAPSIGKLLTRGAGSLGMLIQQQLGTTPRLTARDTSGRAWQLEKLVPVMARDFAYQAYIDTRLRELHASGARQVRLTHPSGEEMVIPFLQALAERTGIFHVNAATRLEAYVPS